MMLASLPLLSNLIVISHFVLLPERALIYLCDRCVAYFQNNNVVLYFPPRNVRGYATIMVYLHRSSSHSKILHFLSCACQSYPYQGWQERCLLLYFFSLHDCHSWHPTQVFFRLCLSFVNVFGDFNSIKHHAGFPERLHIEVLSLQVGFFSPTVRHLMQKDIIEFFRRHIIGGVRSRKKSNKFINFRQSCHETLEEHVARITYCTSHRAILLRKCIQGVEVIA